ncbi:MAG: metallophosphoesterase family protein [Leptospiraceae bacterium]|nr:metallophosphoesterase family protein [Leptospiraceae bacterium]
MEKFIAIGDIHGCLEQLREVIYQLAPYSNDHKLIFLGDYIDRGPDSDGVLTYIRNLKAIHLLGNHEKSLLDFCSNISHKRMLEILRYKNISEDNFEWMKIHLKLFHETENYFFSHAGLNPKKKFVEQNYEDLLWTVYKGSLTHITNKTVVQGHIHLDPPLITDSHIVIDTNCGLGGFLTGIVLPEKILITSKTRSNPPPVRRYF